MTGNSAALDTSTAIAVLNGDAGIAEWLAGFDRIFLPVVVVAELKLGALKSKHVSQNLARVQAIVRVCGVLDIRMSTTDQYARTQLALVRAGTPIPVNDLWIASICLDYDLPLATADAHFSTVQGLMLLRR